MYKEFILSRDRLIEGMNCLKTQMEEFFERCRGQDRIARLSEKDFETGCHGIDYDLLCRFIRK